MHCLGIKSGLYTVLLADESEDGVWRDVWAPRTVTLQYKRSLGYFTMPGSSRVAVAFAQEVYADGPNQGIRVEVNPAALVPDAPKRAVRAYGNKRGLGACVATVAGMAQLTKPGSRLPSLDEPVERDEDGELALGTGEWRLDD